MPKRSRKRWGIGIVEKAVEDMIATDIRNIREQTAFTGPDEEFKAFASNTAMQWDEERNLAYYSGKLAALLALTRDLGLDLSPELLRAARDHMIV